MTEQEFAAAAEAHLGRFAETVIEIMNQNLAQYSVSGQTQESIRAEVLTKAGQYLASLEVAFAESGRFIEMRRLNFGSLPPLDPILAWVRKRGVGTFGYTPGYKRTWQVPTEDARALRLAWAIRHSLKKKAQRRPQRWWSKDFYRSINQIINSVANDYGAYAGQAVVARLRIEA